MKCQRCQATDAAYRVFTDAINIGVCPSCAEEARQLDIATENIPSLGWKKTPVQKRNLPVDMISWSRTHRSSHR